MQTRIETLHNQEVKLQNRIPKLPEPLETFRFYTKLSERLNATERYRYKESLLHEYISAQFRLRIAGAFLKLTHKTLLRQLDSPCLHSDILAAFFEKYQSAITQCEESYKTYQDIKNKFCNDKNFSHHNAYYIRAILYFLGYVINSNTKVDPVRKQALMDFFNYQYSKLCNHSSELKDIPLLPQTRIESHLIGQFPYFMEELRNGTLMGMDSLLTKETDRVLSNYENIIHLRKENAAAFAAQGTHQTHELSLEESRLLQEKTRLIVTSNEVLIQFYYTNHDVDSPLNYLRPSTTYPSDVLINQLEKLDNLKKALDAKNELKKAKAAVILQTDNLPSSNDPEEKQTTELKETEKEISIEELKTMILEHPAYREDLAHIQTAEKNYENAIKEKREALANCTMIELIVSESKPSQNKLKPSVLEENRYKVKRARAQLKLRIAEENAFKLEIAFRKNLLPQLEYSIAFYKAAHVLKLNNYIHELNLKKIEAKKKEEVLKKQVETTQTKMFEASLSFQELERNHLKLTQENLSRENREKAEAEEKAREKEEKEKNTREQAKKIEKTKRKVKKDRAKKKKKVLASSPSHPASLLISSEVKEIETKDVKVETKSIPTPHSTPESIEKSSEDWAGMSLMHFKKIQHFIKLPCATLLNTYHENYLALNHHMRRFFLAFYRYTNGGYTSKTGPCLPNLSKEIVQALRNITTHAGLTVEPRVIINSAHKLVHEMPAHLYALKNSLTGELAFNAEDLKGISICVRDPNKTIFSDFPLYTELKDVQRRVLTQADIASITLKALSLIESCYSNRNFAALETLISRCGEPVRLKALEKRLEKRIVEKDYVEYNNYCEFLKACKKYRNDSAHKTLVDESQLSEISELAKQIDERWLLKTFSRVNTTTPPAHISSTSTSTESKAITSSTTTTSTLSSSSSSGNTAAMTHPKTTSTSSGSTTMAPSTKTILTSMGSSKTISSPAKTAPPSSVTHPTTTTTPPAKTVLTSSSSKSTAATAPTKIKHNSRFK